MATARVRAANSASVSDLAPTLPRSQATPLGPAMLALYAAADLSPGAQDTLYALFAANISPLAEGTSMATPEGAKREEMFDPLARYLVLVRERAMPGSMPGSMSRGAPKSTPRMDIDPADLVGYASFRFDTEETMGPKDVEVVYCYELQLTPSARGAGLGGVLMRELEAIGRAQRMRKCMLTCLTGNTPALAFYAKAGYTPDEIDPTRIADEDGWEDLDENGEENHCDYRIMSKVLK